MQKKHHANKNPDFVIKGVHKQADYTALFVVSRLVWPCMCNLSKQNGVSVEVEVTLIVIINRIQNKECEPYHPITVISLNQTVDIILRGR